MNTKTFSAEDLQLLGRAPECPTCPSKSFMVPLNLKEEPTLCRCPKCGAYGHFTYVN